MFSKFFFLQAFFQKTLVLFGEKSTKTLKERQPLTEITDLCCSLLAPIFRFARTKINF
jgi:hypothetical protein